MSPLRPPPPRARAGFCAGKCGDTADQSIGGGGRLHPRAGRWKHQHLGHRLANTTSNIASVTDSAGNIYQLAEPTTRGTGVSQAIYYAKNIKAAAAGTNKVTTTFNTATRYVDIRALEYSGLDRVNPFNVGTSAAGSGTSANSGAVTTTTPGALIFGAGIATGDFSTAGANFTTRIITTPTTTSPRTGSSPPPAPTAPLHR